MEKVKAVLRYIGVILAILMTGGLAGFYLTFRKEKTPAVKKQEQKAVDEARKNCEEAKEWLKKHPPRSRL